MAPQFTSGTHKIEYLASPYSLRGWVHSWEVNGTKYEWFVKYPQRSLTVPMPPTTYRIVGGDQYDNWWVNDPNYVNWTVAQWGANLLTHLRGYHAGATPVALFKVTAQQW